MPIARLPDLNWRRAFAEAALIFIGITLALLFDNWNQDRKERELELQLLSEVRDDLVETRADLASDIARSERHLKDWRDLTAALLEDAPLNGAWATTLQGTLGGSVLVAKTSGYRSLTSQGLGIISDPAVRKAITDFYELRVARITHFEERSRNYLARDYRPYVRRLIQIPDAALKTAITSPNQLAAVAQFELRDAATLKGDPDLAYNMATASHNARIMLAQYQLTLEETDELIELIDAELADRG